MNYKVMSICTTICCLLSVIIGLLSASVWFVIPTITLSLLAILFVVKWIFQDIRAARSKNDN